MSVRQTQPKRLRFQPKLENHIFFYSFRNFIFRNAFCILYWFIIFLIVREMSDLVSD